MSKIKDIFLALFLWNHCLYLGKLVCYILHPYKYLGNDFNSKWI